MDITQLIDTATTLAAVGVLVAPFVYLLERTHRRASLDAGGRVDRWLRAQDHDDADARRVAAELRALPTPPHSRDAAADRRVPQLRGRRHAWVTSAR